MALWNYRSHTHKLAGSHRLCLLVSECTARVCKQTGVWPCSQAPLVKVSWSVRKAIKKTVCVQLGESVSRHSVIQCRWNLIHPRCGIKFSHRDQIYQCITHYDGKPSLSDPISPVQSADHPLTNQQQVTHTAFHLAERESWVLFQLFQLRLRMQCSAFSSFVFFPPHSFGLSAHLAGKHGCSRGEGRW